MTAQTQRTLTTTFLTLTLILFTVAASLATQPSRQAPFEISAWVQGEETARSAFENGDLIVVEFFSTWCAACNGSAPELSRIHRELHNQGVTVIALSDEDIPTLRTFIAQFNSGLSYPIGIDPDNEIFMRYMQPLDLNGIPYCFILDPQGDILWHGHPDDGLEETLSGLLDGALTQQKLQQQLQDKQDVAKSRSLLEAYSILSRYPEEQDLTRQLAQRIILYGKSDLKHLALLSLVFIHDVQDYPMAAQSIVTAFDQPDTELAQLSQAYTEIMQDLQIPAPVIETMRQLLRDYQQQHDRSALEKALPEFFSAL